MTRGNADDGAPAMRDWHGKPEAVGCANRGDLCAIPFNGYIDLRAIAIGGRAANDDNPGSEVDVEDLALDRTALLTNRWRIWPVAPGRGPCMRGGQDAVDGQ